jgi:hypothetical protein
LFDSTASLRLRKNVKIAPVRKATATTRPMISPAVSPAVKYLCFDDDDVAAAAVTVAVWVLVDAVIVDLLEVSVVSVESVVSGCEKERTCTRASLAQK